MQLLIDCNLSSRSGIIQRLSEKDLEKCGWSPYSHKALLWSGEHLRKTPLTETSFRPCSAMVCFSDGFKGNVWYQMNREVVKSSQEMLALALCLQSLSNHQYPWESLLMACERGVDTLIYLIKIHSFTSYFSSYGFCVKRVRGNVHILRQNVAVMLCQRATLPVCWASRLRPSWPKMVLWDLSQAPFTVGRKSWWRRGWFLWLKHLDEMNHCPCPFLGLFFLLFH